MAWLLLFSLLTVFIEIVGSSYLLIRAIKGRLGSAVIEALAASISAVLISWAIPLESVIGATLRFGWFEPWSIGWMIGFWAFIAVPTAVLLHSKV